MKKTLAIIFAASITFSGFAQDIKLAEPAKTGGMPLMSALAARKSTRAFSPKEIPSQTLSNLLWAASGLNRENGKMTAPTACNWQEIEIYAFMKSGVYLYMPKENILKKCLEADMRAMAGIQDFVKTAPVVLVYVADRAKMKGRDGKDADEKAKDFYCCTDTGFVSQNVYLFCASEKLNTVVLGLVDRVELEKALKLSKEKKVILSQPVGLPPEVQPAP
ncbi:MAG: hypothetical protein A2020_12630 [Lentisphaerae bacterium GWF2_45_14]|nr:MAG: hypothetical protein A2020_12630 [Lentisphaerae bacterium GWF2_45_14]